MTLNISPQMEANLQLVANLEGIDLSALIEKMFHEYQTAHYLASADDNREAVNLLRSWRDEDATDDEVELERRDKETEQLMQNLSRGRVSFDIPKL